MLQSMAYSIDFIQDEVKDLLYRGFVSRSQPIYALCKYIPAREWSHIEAELEVNGFLLRDRIGDLVGRENWDND
jgi:uncharacterized protein YqgQ